MKRGDSLPTCVVLVLVLDCVGRARLQNVTGCWHDLASTADSSNKRSSMAEPGVWRVKRLDFIFPPVPEYFFACSRAKAQFKEEGTTTHPMSSPRPIPGSAMLRKPADQASAEVK